VLPAKFRLEQNYPNPFNPVTKIRFAIEKVDRVKLEIYSITGQKIATLVDQRMKAGQHEIEWNASQVASGVYFYKFYYGSLNMTKKMVLIR
jgi:flagellar hook assembly protein FlgD